MKVNTYFEEGFEFAHIDNRIWMLKELLLGKIGRHFVTGEQVEMIETVLRLNFMDDDYLQPIRNSVVRELSKEGDKYFEEENFDKWEEYSILISATTSVIDRKIFEAGLMY